MSLTASPFTRLAAGCAAALALATGLSSTPTAQAGDPGKSASAKVDVQELYQQKCQVCHMADGNSQIMPNMSFADGVWKNGATVKDVTTTITNGVPGTAMVAFKEQLSPAEITALARFVRKFDKKLK
jgi:mono/diheme cytochrome c family protein